MDGRRDCDLPEDWDLRAARRRCSARWRSGAKQHQPSDRRRPRGEANILKSVPADSTLRAAGRFCIPNGSAARAFYLSYCMRLPPGRRKGVGKVSAARRQSRSDRARPGNVFTGDPGRNSAASGYGAMPALPRSSPIRQIADLVKYLRASWGNNAPANASVADIRRARVSSIRSWTWD